MADPAFYRDATIESLCWRAADVTPNDGADLPSGVFARITATGAGNIRVTCSGGGTVTLAIAAGGILPVFVDRVLASSTTATGIVALYGA